MLLQCTTEYPSKVEEANLRAMNAMCSAFDLPVGYSDHTESPVACIAAVARGACMIEKHFTLDRKMSGPDHAASFDTEQFSGLVVAIREAEVALGSAVKQPTPVEIENMKTMRRSLAARKDLSRGEVLVEESIGLLRPASGLSPAVLPLLIGRKLRRSVSAGQFLTLEDFADEA